jgi:hypothetical protein
MMDFNTDALGEILKAFAPQAYEAPQFAQMQVDEMQKAPQAAGRSMEVPSITNYKQIVGQNTYDGPDQNPLNPEDNTDWDELARIIGDLYGGGGAGG